MISVSDDERATRTWEAGLFDRLMRDVRAMPSFDASRPVRIAPIDEPNVFEQPRAPTDPPPPWASAPKAANVARTVLVRKRKEEPRSGASWLAIVTSAAIGAAIMLVAVHPPARDVLHRAFDRAAKVLLHRV